MAISFFRDGEDSDRRKIFEMFVPPQENHITFRPENAKPPRPKLRGLGFLRETEKGY